MKLRTFDEPVVWIGALLSVIGLAGVTVAGILEVSIGSIVLGHLSGVSLGAGLVELLLHFTTAKRLLGQVSAQVMHALQLPVEAFYQSRHDLPRLEQEFEGASEIWLAWHIGSVQGSGTLSPRALPSRNTRLLLTHPDSRHLDELAKVLGRSRESMQSNIMEVTRLARESGIAVRWFDGPFGSSMVIVNPQSPTGWARLEIIIPYGRPTERPSIRVSNRKGQEAFQKVLNSYEQVWSKAIEAPLELRGLRGTAAA